MGTRTKNFKEGKADAALLFTVGIFFLVLAIVVVYVSHFGMAPLQKLHKPQAMSGAAVLPFSTIPLPQDDTMTTDAAQQEAFLSSLGGISVKEIFIGSYGSVDKEILEKLKGALEEAYGVQVTILNPGSAVPKEEPFFKSERNQYDSDVLLKSIVRSSSSYGQEVRFLYVVDTNMASFSELPGADWSRADRGVNAALLSLYPLERETDKSITPRHTLIERAEKSAIRAIGTTVGLEASPSRTDTSCIMYPALTLEDLDAQQNTLCTPEQEGVARVFQK